MPDEEPFLAAIYADPDDDAPRLAFADWLDEHGEPERAEFIRLQCRIAAGEPYTIADENRVEELADAYRAEWTRHLPAVPSDRWNVAGWGFLRGMPEELVVAADDFFAAYSTWAAPSGVRSIEILDLTAGDLRAFAEHRWNTAWTVLRLTVDPRPWMQDQLGTNSGKFVPVARSPQAEQLRELHLCWFGLGGNDITALCESPHLDGLRVLGVPESAITDPRLVARFGERLRKIW